MNTLLQERIFKDFPNIKWEGSAKHDGIECGTGWGLLVYAFFRMRRNYAALQEAR